MVLALLLFDVLNIISDIKKHPFFSFTPQHLKIFNADCVLWVILIMTYGYF
jgi:hypothetical protein